jgi:phage I-like protein
MLTDQERAICHQIGVAPEDFLAAKEAELEEAACRKSTLMGISPQEAKRRQAEVKKKAEAVAPLTEEEEEACRVLGVEPLEYYAAKMEEAGLKPVLR